MYIPEITAIIGILATSFIFYMYARRINLSEKTTIDGYMVANSTLKKSQFSNTFSASNISLCMIVIFYGSNAKSLGLFLFSSCTTYLLGHLAFVWLIRKTNFDLSECKTLTDLVNLIFPNRAVVLLVSLMSISSYILLAYVELYIGSVLFSIFLPEGIVYQTISFLAIGILVLLYVRLGGYKALVVTDRWQLGLITLSIGSILIFGLIVPVSNNSSFTDVIVNMTNYTESTWYGIVFSLWLLMINSIYGFSQVSSWQRVHASSDHDMSWKGIVDSSWKVIMLFSMTILGFILLISKGYEFTSIIDYLYLVRDTGGISKYILFPVMLIGYSSMVFSSADVAIIGVNYSLTDRSGFYQYFSKLDEKSLRRALSNMTLAILLILTFFYYLNYSALGEWLMPIIFTACSQLGVLAPIPIFTILYLKKYGELPKIETSKRNILIFFNGIFLSWIVLFLGTYLSKTTGKQIFSLLPLPVGIIFTASAIIAITRTKNVLLGGRTPPIQTKKYGVHYE